MDARQQIYVRPGGCEHVACALWIPEEFSSALEDIMMFGLENHAKQVMKQ